MFSAPEEAGGGAKVFAAGLSGQPQDVAPLSQISHDGTTLFLDAITLDNVDSLVMDGKPTLYEKPGPFLGFLEFMTGLPPVYHPGNCSSLDAIATTIASSLPPYSSSNVYHDTREYPELGVAPEGRPRIWLCELIDREVRHWVTSLSDTLHSPVNKDGEDRDSGPSTKLRRWQLESYQSVYQQLTRKFDNAPWPRTGNAASSFPSEPAATAVPSTDHSLSQENDEATTMGRLRNKLVTKVHDFDTKLDIFREPPSVSLSARQPLSLGAQRYGDAFQTSLIWRNLFKTRDGLLGMGPSWMRRNDKVMLIRGAAVPYIFRHVDDDLEDQIKALRMGIEKRVKAISNRSDGNSSRRSSTLLKDDEELGKAKEELTTLQGQIGRWDAWVLVGEAYVEGMMRGEALRVSENVAFERISVI